jgi:hypothetical protein
VKDKRRCYSWMTGISEVGQVFFARIWLVEVYLRTTIRGIRSPVGGHDAKNESAEFLPRTQVVSVFRKIPAAGVRIWDSGTLSGKAGMALVLRPWAEDLGWLDDRNYSSEFHKQCFSVIRSKRDRRRRGMYHT